MRHELYSGDGCEVKVVLSSRTTVVVGRAGPESVQMKELQSVKVAVWQRLSWFKWRYWLTYIFPPLAIDVLRGFGLKKSYKPNATDTDTRSVTRSLSSTLPAKLQSECQEMLKISLGKFVLQSDIYVSMLTLSMWTMWTDFSLTDLLA